MSSAADRAREKAGRIGSRPARPVPPPPYSSMPPVDVTPDQPAPDERPASRPASPDNSRAARTKPVRMTLDLAPALHAEFDDWTTRTFRELGLARINRADVLRVLVRQLLNDPETAERVRDALRDGSLG